MSLQDKIQKAKSRLMLEHPYFGTIASSLSIELDEDIESFASDGERLRYNDDYFDSVGADGIEFALANGAMHKVLGHQSRIGERYEWLWQLATDYTINSILLHNGLALPPNANFQDRFDSMYAEEIYEILHLEIPQEEQDQAQETYQSKKEQNSSHNDDDELLEQIFQKMKAQGRLPKDIEYLLPEYFSNQIEWRDILYRYIASYAKDSFSFMPPNMKYLYRGIYLPSLSSDLLRIVIAIDSSGSVDDRLLSIFIAEVESIVQQYINFEIDIIVADSKIQSHRVFLSGEILEYTIKGRGGTDFGVVFEYIDEQIDYPSMLLYFTDGYGTFPIQEPHYDTLWIMPHEIEVPFGEVLVVSSKAIR
jgi:predicted metal-dependent peptidase